METKLALKELQDEVIRCQKCSRLIEYLKEVSYYKPKRYQNCDYWAKPLPSFGDPNAHVLIIGLAPAAHGGNRTGRMFTGDRSGEWLFNALYQYGFANQPNSLWRDDGFRLRNCYITATIRCAPPKNKPLPEEIENCQPYLLQELVLLKKIRAIIPLGQIAFTQTIKVLRIRGYEVPSISFAHGKHYLLSKKKEPHTISLIPSYHPSQQNTFTGKLTRAMFHRIFRMVKNKLEDKI